MADFDWTVICHRTEQTSSQTSRLPKTCLPMEMIAHHSMLQNLSYIGGPTSFVVQIETQWTQTSGV